MTTSNRNAASAAHNEGIKFANAGDNTSATLRLRDAIEISGIDRADPRTLKALWQVAIKDGNWKTGIAAGMLAAARDPLAFRFAQDVLLSLARCPLSALVSGERSPLLPFKEDLPSLSVIIVSEQDSRFHAVDAEYEMAFSAWPHERIRVKGVRSMYDGYARGLAQSSGEIVVFSHDDIRFATPDFAARFASAIRNSDFVGVAGTTRVSGPALLWSGHPYLFGTVTHKSERGSDYEFSVLSLRGPRINGAQGLDGVFIAGRRAWVERVGFDIERFTGFHFYDLDFSYRAYCAGARVTIASDLGLIHRSRGPLSESWLLAQRAFANKFSLDHADRGGGECPLVCSALARFRLGFHDVYKAIRSVGTQPRLKMMTVAPSRRAAASRPHEARSLRNQVGDFRHRHILQLPEQAPAFLVTRLPLVRRCEGRGQPFGQEQPRALRAPRCQGAGFGSFAAAGRPLPAPLRGARSSAGRGAGCARA